MAAKNESALFILLIFYLKTKAKIKHFIEVKELKVGGIILWNKCFSPEHIGNNYLPPFIKYFLQPPFAKITALSLPLQCLMSLTGDQRPFLHTESLQILQIPRSMMLVLLLFSSDHSFSIGLRSGTGMAIADAWFCAQWAIFALILMFVFGPLSCCSKHDPL